MRVWEVSLEWLIHSGEQTRERRPQRLIDVTCIMASAASHVPLNWLSDGRNSESRKYGFHFYSQGLFWRAHNDAVAGAVHCARTQERLTLELLAAIHYQEKYSHYIKMALGKTGMRLEAWKFGIYLFIPIAASVYFNDPERQRYWADYFQFLKYPSSPNTNLKSQFEDLVEQQEKQKQQRDEYAEQMRKLQESAQKSRERREEVAQEENKRGWLQRLGLRRTQE